MELLEHREHLLHSARRKGPKKLAEYRARRNAQSIDGLPGLVPDHAAEGKRDPAGGSSVTGTPASRSRP